jgi:lipopolysaccharide transport system permease protein
MDFLPSETLVGDPPAVKSVIPNRPHLTIKPAVGGVPLDLPEMWHFRDLLFALALRDVKLRYKQTALGVVWVILQPLMMAGVLSFVFGTVAHMTTGPIPPFLFSYVGMMGWNLFSNVLTKAGGSLVGNSNLISKVFFPRLILPLSSLPSALVDFAVAVGMLSVLMIIYHVTPSWGVVLLPVWLTMLLFAATGIGLVATSLMVSYRDVQYVMPVALQILLYASPIAYSVSKVPEKYRFYFSLNPLASIFEAIRWSVFGMGTLDVTRLCYGGVASVIILLAGVYSFKQMEQKFADVI